MIIFFSGTSVILGAIIFVLLILSAVMGTGRVLQDVLQDYSFEMIMILSALAIIYWQLLLMAQLKKMGTQRKSTQRFQVCCLDYPPEYQFTIA